MLKKSPIEDCTSFINTLMTDITATWGSNSSSSLPLTDYREATFEEAALFSFKRCTEMQLSNDKDDVLINTSKSKLTNPYFAFAVRLKQLAAKISNSDLSYSYAAEIFALLGEAPMSQFSITLHEQKYTKLMQNKLFLEQKQTELDVEIRSIQTRLDLPESEFIRTDDQLSILEAAVDTLELEVQRALHHGSNKKS